MEKRQVLLDTNILFVPFRFRVDIFAGIEEMLSEPWEAVVSSRIIRELRRVAQRKGRHAIEAKLALSMLEKKQVKIIASEMPVDEWLFSYAKEHGAVVVTNDSELIKKLKKNGIKVLVLRAKARIGSV
jgi:rRNA-processing protein FCF1